MVLCTKSKVEHELQTKARTLHYQMYIQYITDFYRKEHEQTVGLLQQMGLLTEIFIK